jgi:AraC family transcriptional regulator
MRYHVTMLADFEFDNMDDFPVQPRNVRSAIDRVTMNRDGQFLAESVSVLGGSEPIKGHTAEFQLILPYSGMFEWDIGKGAVILDANQAMLAAGGQDFEERQPAVRLRHSAFVITPTCQILDEIFAWARRNSALPPTDVALPVSPKLRLLVQNWIRALQICDVDSMALDELGIASFQEAFHLSSTPNQACPRVVRLAKQLVHDRLFDHLSLQSLADAIDVSPVYLTQCFSRAEGKPLYRYVLHLRLAHAMLELPNCEDITVLALDLGFSSHSHFSTAFKAFAGMSPSAFRESFGRRGASHRYGHA